MMDDVMIDYVEKAKEVALKAHGEQDHGSMKIADHLDAVTNKIREEFPKVNKGTGLGSLTNLLIVGWLHDTLEDTSLDIGYIRKEFGDYIGDLVQAVTDGEGHNRLARHLNTYHRTRQRPESIFVKMADRWHNQHRSILNKERFASMYAKEYIYFKFALYTPGQFDDFWKQLDAQHELLKNV
jgi:(p)ppGpp synthase/HD superfamily hydrolase